MGQTFLGSNQSHIYPNMCAKFGCSPTVVSKKGGVQTSAGSILDISKYRDTCERSISILGGIA